MNVVIFLTLLLGLSLVHSEIISLPEDGGYSNIAVTIGNEVEDDESMLTAKTDLQTNVSSNIVSVLLKKDDTPPATVVDLTISNVSRDDEGFNFTLRWTAAGDDLWEGTADLLDLRVSSQQDNLIVNFTEQTKINADSLLKGSLLPVEGGTQMEISLPLSKDLFQNVTQLYFGLKYFDEEGNEGNVSNIVQFELNSIAYSEGESREIKNSQMKREGQTITIGVIITIVFMLGVLAGLFYFLKRNHDYKRVTMYKSNA